MKFIEPCFAVLLRAVTCTILALSLNVELQAADERLDVAGTWTWTSSGRDGGFARKSILTLKVDGDKVTGSVSSPNRNGQTTELEIADGKLQGDDISFSVTREFGGNKVTQKFNGKIAGESITGKVSFERNGVPSRDSQSRDWGARRETR